MAETCSVIFLGAWNFERNSAFTNRAFRRSKADFEDYLRSPVPRGLGVLSSRVLDLFNSPLEPGKQLRQIGDFVEQIRAETPDSVRDLIVYYVGHGYFGGHDRQFYVAVASMDTAVPDATGLRIASLGEVLKPYVRSFRIYYLLDCCFAGEALKALQAGGEGVAIAAHLALKVEAPQAHSMNPRRGSALLCATSKDDFAMAPSDLGRTVFSDALIEALRDGDSELGPRLTLAQLKDVVWDRIRAKHEAAPEHQVRPVIHAPDQSDGDVSTQVALFPNPAWRQRIEPTEHAITAAAAEPRKTERPLAPPPHPESLSFDRAPAARASPDPTSRTPDAPRPPRKQSTKSPVDQVAVTGKGRARRGRIVAILTLVFAAAWLLIYLALNDDKPPPANSLLDPEPPGQRHDETRSLLNFAEPPVQPTSKGAGSSVASNGLKPATPSPPTTGGRSGSGGRR
jgi:uncharacterized caspase-like protein